jgi:GNAT superfamily N-acetyltransferase
MMAGTCEPAREIVCADGTRVRIRAIRGDDASRLMALHERLSVQTIYRRFFTVIKRLPADWAHRLATVDHMGREALVVEHGPPGGPGADRGGPIRADRRSRVGGSRVRGGGPVAGQGIGTALFRELLRVADAHGIRRFRALVLADNPRMVDLIARLTEIRSRSLDHGILTLDFVRSCRAHP